MNYVVLRPLTAEKDRVQEIGMPGVCRICRCTEMAACPSGCAWASKTQTLCSACCAFSEITRREAVAVLYHAGYVSKTDLRSVRAELQDAIEDFTVVIEAITGDADELESAAFALRRWRTVEAIKDELLRLGYTLVTLPAQQLRCA